MSDREQKSSGFLYAVKEFVCGVAEHDSAQFALKTSASMEHLFGSSRKCDLTFMIQEPEGLDEER